jgi:two-component sensor histidine kinase
VQVIDDLDEKKKEALRLTWERVRSITRLHSNLSCGSSSPTWRLRPVCWLPGCSSVSPVVGRC